jgi:hypothetical protein
MSLEGLRAWIGEVERKLGMRTRVFLVLSVIALGGAGAAIYLAVDAREDSVSESDVRALQERLETRIGEAAAGTAPLTPEEPAESVEPAPQPEPKPEGDRGGATGATGAGGTGGAASEGSGAESGGASAPGNAGSAKLRELAEQAAANAEADEKKEK